MARDYIVGQSPQSAVIGDFNGDGRIDIITANHYSNDFSVLLQNADGTFPSALTFPQGSSGPFTIAAADFNNDGKLDLIGFNASATIAVLIGNGDATFQSPIFTNLGGPSFIRAMVVADFNGDGKLDVGVAVPLPQAGSFAIAILLGNADGTFQAPVNYSVSDDPLVIQVADFNGDGKLDLVTGFRQICVLLGNGDGTFQAPISTHISAIVVGITVGDFNNDGKVDAAVGSNTNPISVLLGNGDGTFRELPQLTLQGTPTGSGDLNHDGKLDIVTDEGFVGVGAGDGNFNSEQQLILRVLSVELRDSI